MTTTVFPAISGPVARARAFFATRDFLFHDGRGLREFSVAGRTQMALASIAAVTLVFSAYGVAQAAGGALEVAGVADAAGASDAEVARLRTQVQSMKADVAAMKAVNERVEARQLALAAQAQRTVEFRLAMTAKHVRRLGISPGKVVRGGVGGPFEPVDGATPAPETTSDAAADAQFRTLFQTWKKLDTLEQTVIAIPSMQPVDNLLFTSNFGIRSDPFRGVAAMHAGVDIPGPIGTPIYATADGMIARAERSGGYGNLVEVNHGKGIETRYGHLSKILVQPNTRVRRGQLIGLMGSTGRSTGSHLHYEVRIEGRAVNPVPYLQTADTMLAIQDKALKSRQVAMGGPAANR